MVNEILEKLNAQHTSTAPTEIDERFMLSLKNVFSCLALDEDEDPTQVSSLLFLTSLLND